MAKIRALNDQKLSQVSEVVKFKGKMPVIKAQLSFVQEAREQLKAHMEIDHYLADYITTTWYLGHTFSFKDKSDEQIMLMNAGIGYLNNQYGKRP